MAGRGRPFEKGHKGGPGRPPRATEERDLERVRRIYTKEREDKAIEQMAKAAESGSLPHMEWLDVRLYGKIVDRKQIDVTNIPLDVVLDPSDDSDTPAEDSSGEAADGSTAPVLE